MEGINSIISRITSEIDKRQFLPSLDDLKDDKLNDMVNKIKSNNLQETLTNILEWQDRNIGFWNERGYLDTQLKILLVAEFFIIFMLFYFPFAWTIYVIAIKYINNYLFPKIISVVSVAVLVFFFLKQRPLTRLIHLVLLSLLLYIMLKEVAIENSLSTDIDILNFKITVYNISYINGAFLGIVIFILFYLSISYSSLVKEEKTIKKLREIINLLNSTFMLSIPIRTILKYKLAICRDYAKLTAAILFNLFPEKEVYFFTIPQHVAAGIKIGETYYILDQHLPINNFQSWCRYWKRRLDFKKVSIYKAKIYKNRLLFEKAMEKPIDKENCLIRNVNIDIKKLNEKLSKELIHLKTKMYDNVEIYKIEYPYFTILYEKDEIIEYSLIRKIKMIVEKEFCSNIKKINNVELEIEGNNLGVILNIVK